MYFKRLHAVILAPPRLVNKSMGVCRKAAVTKVALVVAGALLLWHFYLDRDTTSPIGEEELVRLEKEENACLWRKGLEAGSVLGDEHVFSTFNCPVGEDIYPQGLCTTHLVFLDHSEKRFVARTPADMTSR